MYLKIHESYRKVAALCDKELLGKKFEQGKMQLDIKENFYRGDVISEEKLIEKLKQLKLDDATFNVVGKKSVNAAIKAGIITEKNTGEVQGVPFALLLL